MKSTIRLFKAVPITNRKKGIASDGLWAKTIKRGFVFSPEVVSNYSPKELLSLVRIIEKEIGLTAEQMNSAFHKSWEKVKNAEIEKLVIEQLIHYFTTYGFEDMGIYSPDSVYVPAEKLEIPELEQTSIPLVVICGLTKIELKERLLSFLNSGIALAEDTKRDVLDVATFVEIQTKEIDVIKNKEIKIALYDYLNLFPSNPVKFLRYVIYKSTNRTLLIKDKVTIGDIKSKDNLGALGLFTRYQNEYRLQKLAEIFYRFKPLFLAFRTNKGLKILINKIRRLATSYHKPMEEDFLNGVTAKIKNGWPLNSSIFKRELLKVNNFRKIRLAYALKFRTNEDIDSILYRIRNGKGYATDFKFYEQDKAKATLDFVLDSLVESIYPKVRCRKIYIPENINYALPSTEKQFTGDFPSGSFVSLPKDMIFGIHWDNVDGNRIDLDLSLINAQTGKFGWDGYYRDESRDILFSGDITDPHFKNGASELFYITKRKKGSYLVFLNYFNYDEKIEVPYKIVVAQEHPHLFEKNYVINPNKVVATTKAKIKEKQKVIGLLVVDTEECKFYFCETALGLSITSSNNEFSHKALKYLKAFYENTIGLREILERAGADLVDDREDCEINLSPESINKTTVLELIS